jgi:DNA-binding CsgD family transcriptional regulator
LPTDATSPRQGDAPVDDDQRLSELIGDIYDAVLDQSCWPDVIDRAVRFICAGATLFSGDPAGQFGDVRFDAGIDLCCEQLCFDKPIARDPVAVTQLLEEIEKPCATELRLRGPVDFGTAVLDRPSAPVAMSGMFRHERNGLHDEVRRRMGLVVPHIRRAVLIGGMLDRKEAQITVFAETLDRLSGGVCLVEADGRVAHANAAAHALIAAGGVFRIVNGRLVANEARTDQALKNIYAAASQGEVAPAGISIPLTGSDGERYVVHALPLTSGMRRQACTADTVAAALFVRRAVMFVPSPPEVIGKAFRLTPSEFRVLLAIVELGSVARASAALGISVSTVKTHLGRVFEKTGSARQADLVKLVAAYASPLTE